MNRLNRVIRAVQEAESLGVAKAICAGCPVRAQCLDYAITYTGELQGI